MTLKEWITKFKKQYWRLSQQEIWDAALEHGDNKYKNLLDEYFDSDMDLDDLWNAYKKLKG